MTKFLNSVMWAGRVPSASTEDAPHLVTRVASAWRAECGADGANDQRRPVVPVNDQVRCGDCLDLAPAMCAAVGDRVTAELDARRAENEGITAFLAWASNRDAVLASYAGDTRLRALLEHGRARLLDEWATVCHREPGRRVYGDVPGSTACDGCGDYIRPNEIRYPAPGRGVRPGWWCVVCRESDRQADLGDEVLARD